MSDSSGEVHFTIDVPVVGHATGHAQLSPVTFGRVDVHGARVTVRVSVVSGGGAIEVAIRAPGDDRATLYEVSIPWLMRRLAFAHVSEVHAR